MTRLFATVCSFLTAAAAFAQGAGEDCPPPSMAVYENIGVVTNAQVDATTFINTGDFYVRSFDLPWEAQNVRNWTNSGRMLGSIGFRLNYTTCHTDRFPSDVFVNERTGIIDASDGGGFSLFVDDLGSLIDIGLGGGFSFQDVSYLTINAERIVNRGHLNSGPSGLIQLTGETVDLSGGTVIVDPISLGGFGGGILTSNRFIPDEGLYDLAWGIDIRTNFFVGNILNIFANQTNIFSGPFNITNESFSCTTSLLLTNAATWVYVNQPSGTNLNIQVVAVQTRDTNIFTDVRFFDGLYTGGPALGGYLTPVVRFSSPATNIINLRSFTNELYLVDQLGSDTNSAQALNLPAGTFRPAPFILTRFDPFFFDFGNPSNEVIFPDIFDSPAYSNRIVTNLYAAYSAEVDYLSSRLPALPDVGYTNLPGRVEIQAENLDLTLARIRGEGLVQIQTTNLIESTSAVIDVPRLSLNLGSTSQPRLRVESLARDQVERFGGSLAVFSTIWTNMMSNPDTNAGPIELRFQLLMVDAREMSTIENVTTHELHLHSPGPEGAVLINDNFNVTDQFEVDAPNLTVNSRIILARGLSWSPTNLVRLENLTNNGVLQLTGLAEFQQPGGAPLDAFVNRGRVMAFSHLIDTEYFENSGSIVSTQFFRQEFTNFCLGTTFALTNSASSVGAIDIHADQARLEGGSLGTSGDILLSGGLFRIHNTTIASEPLSQQNPAGGGIRFTITGALTDTGPEAGNRFDVRDGFSMSPRPANGGNLFGTRITSFAEEFAIVGHTWAAEDRGATAAGFTNNLAIGVLELNGSILSRFNFAPGVPNSAIYVDRLVLSGEQAASLAALTNSVRLNGINIYYAYVESTNINLHAESLNNLRLGSGRLIWVPDFAGPNSYVDVPVSDTSNEFVRINRALRESPNIDSDGDGIPNRSDEFPTNPEVSFRIASVEFNAGARNVTFSFGAEGSSGYVIEYTDDLAGGEWKPVNDNLPVQVNGGIMSFTEQVPADVPQRYYRVRMIE